MKKGSLHVLKVLDAMEDYLSKSDHNFHNSLFMAYCNNCRAISSVGGDYIVHVGGDCLGDHYETQKAPEQCTKCHTDNFIKISRDDMSKLRDVYRGRTSEIVINGIKEGLEDMNFSSLYNEDLPKIANKWKRLSKQEKTRQINQLLSEQKKLSIVRKQVENLEEVLIV